MTKSITYTQLSPEEKVTIKKLYLDEKLNPKEIGKKINRNCTAIRRYLMSQNLYFGKKKEILSDFKEIPLTEREQEVYSLCLKGYSRKDIANYLNISITTTITHLNHIYLKKGCNSHVSLLAKRIQELEKEKASGFRCKEKKI